MTRIINSPLAGFALLTSVSLLLLSCRNSPKAFTLTGRVISKQPETQELIVDNDNIPGFMTTMTMPYPVKDSEGFQKVQRGDVIHADVIVQEQGQFWLEHVTVVIKGSAQPPAKDPTPQVLKVHEYDLARFRWNRSGHVAR